MNHEIEETVEQEGIEKIKKSMTKSKTLRKITE